MPRPAAQTVLAPQRAPADVIYLDNAATTPMHPLATAELVRGLELVGDPSSRHAAGQACREALDGARARVAQLLGCAPPDVVFTGGGSEAINLALHGTFAAADFRGHLVTTGIEHSAVLECASRLRRRGVDVTLVPALPSGQVDPDAVRDAMRADTRLVSVMHVNNETGAVQDVHEITAIAHAAGAAMHVDAVQSAGKLPVSELTADLVSVSAHKFGGPKGIGALRVRDGHALEPLVCGGAQESGRRGGTENVAGALAMAAAATAALPHVGDDEFRQDRQWLRTHLVGMLSVLGDVSVNGADPVLAEIVSVRFAGVRGDTLADVLDAYGICVSTGSACHPGDDPPSHVLTAMGLGADDARDTIRISIGHATTVHEVDAAIRRIVVAVQQLRHSTPRR